MPLRVHDTRRREKVDFTTMNPGVVNMYVCGNWVVTNYRMHVLTKFSFKVSKTFTQAHILQLLELLLLLLLLLPVLKPL